MNRFLFLTCLFLSIISNAQSEPVLHWAKTYGSMGGEGADAVAYDEEGNVYLVGGFSSVVDFDPGPGVFNMTGVGNAPDAYVLKLDALGDFVWAKRMGGSQGNWFTRIGFADNGDLILAGGYSGTVDFNPNAGTFNLTSTPLLNYPSLFSTDISVVRLTRNGDFVWAKSFGSTQPDALYDMTIDSSGNIILTGSYADVGDFDPGPDTLTFTATGTWDVYLVKLDGSGNLVWGKTFGTESDVRANAIKTDADDNVYLVGNYTHTLDADPNAGEFLLPPGPADSFGQSFYQGMVIKLDSGGDFQWAGKFGGDMMTIINAVEVDANQNVYLCGSFASESDMDPGEGEYILDAGIVDNLPRNAIFITKLNADGSFNWAKHFPPSNGEVRMLKYAGNELLLAGYYQYQFSINDEITLTPAGNRDLFLARFDNLGNALWAKSFGGPELDEMGKPAYDPAGIWYIPGYFAGTADLDPSDAVLNITSAGYNDAFVLRFGPEELGVSDLVADDWSLYPNPSDGKVNFKLPSGFSDASVEVYNLPGQVVSEKNLNLNQTEITLPSGHYLVKLTSGGKSSVKKLIVN